VIQLADIPHQGLRERMTDPTQHRDLILEYVDRAVAKHPWQRPHKFGNAQMKSDFSIKA